MQHQATCCLLQILAASSDQLAEARREISVMSKVDHDNVLPLLASAVVASTREGVPQHTVYMLYPLYEVSWLHPGSDSGANPSRAVRVHTS